MNSKHRTLKVGVFVALGLVLATMAVFLIGDNRRAWDRKRTFKARFNDVAGLKPGSAVRIGGLDVGTVSTVKHAPDAGDSSVYVTIVVSRDEAERVKPDTKASVTGKGLLGDKMVILSGGDPSADPAPDGSTIASEPDPKDFGKTMDRFDDISRKADATLDAVKRTSEGLADPRVAEDLRGSMHALRTVLEGIANEKNGAAHKLIFDPDEGRRVDRILANLDATTANLVRASADAKDITARAKSGPGLVHTLFYDPDLASGTTGTMVELNKSLAAVRTGNGLARVLIYGDDATTQHVMGNVNAMSDDLREIVANVKAGRGTLGALLVDPTVYEDIKSLIGNIERNQVLRALVRYSIKQNEDKPHAKVDEAVEPTVQPAQQSLPKAGVGAQR